MFKILDGRDKFYQWDINRKLIVDDSTITQVHFCNRTDNCSIVCETFKEDGLTVVNVPNILLQSDWKIRVYAYDGEHTKHDACYEVASRTKPSDYVYTETEILSYAHLEERISAIEENGGGASITVDSAMSSTSTNPVENKIVKEYVDMSFYNYEAQQVTYKQTVIAAKETADTALTKAENALSVGNSAGNAAYQADTKAKAALTQAQSNTLAIGNIENALNEIIEIQEAFIGGNG